MSQFVKELSKADVIRVDEGPLLTSFDHDEESGDVSFSWVDEDNGFAVEIPSANAEAARFEGNGFVVTDSEGDSVKVEIFSLMPEYPVPQAFVDHLLRTFEQVIYKGYLPRVALEGVMDNLVDELIGGHAGCVANNEGWLGQIKALYEASRGKTTVITNSLAWKLSNCTTTSYEAWEKDLNAFGEKSSLEAH